MKKTTAKIIITLITSVTSISVALITGFFGGRSYEKREISNTLTNEIGAQVVNVYSEGGFVKAFIELYNAYGQLLEKNTTLQSYYDSMSSDYQELQQRGSYWSQLEATNSKLNSDLEQSESELAKLKEINSELSSQISNVPSVEFVSPSLYIDSEKLSDLYNSVVLINEAPYYSENALKMILRNLGKEYEYTAEEIYIGKKSETEKIPLSQVKIYDLGDNASQASGIRSDISGNEFSGLLLETYGHISYFVDKKYSKICGAIHIVKETSNSRSGTVSISTFNENQEETVVYTSDTLNNLSDVVYFSDVPINNAKVVNISVSGHIKAVISEAYFYN